MWPSTLPLRSCLQFTVRPREGHRASSCRSLYRGARRPPPSSRNGRPSSNGNNRPGIGYLDTWIGSKNVERVAGPPAAAVRPRMPPDSRLSGAPSMSIMQTAERPGHALSASTQSNRLPSSSYQIFSLRPTAADSPETLLERLNELVGEQPYNNSEAESGSFATLPLVLDLSAFHPDGSPHFASAEEGTLSGFVDAIRSHQIDGQSKVGYCIVGVANLPPNDRSMVEEARSLGLPIFQGSNQSLEHRQSDASSTTKKRGGVAPLLRQRRPGVAASTRSIKDDDSQSTISTKDGITADDGVQIVGMGKLPAPNQAGVSTKVHKGSVRSGQLLSSDLPNQSLVIIGSVNPGGEVWCEGDVYVFGKLRGRVLAGLSNVGGGAEANGDGGNAKYSPEEKQTPRSASRIFATSFDPELVGIADVFTTVDDVVTSCGLDGVGPAMVSVDDRGEKLLFERIEL